MANQQNRQQPFRFWFPGWTNPPPRRPSATQGRSQTRTPATPSQPESPLSQPPKQLQQKPTPSPSTAQAPTNSPQPPPIAQGAPRTPSSSPRTPSSSPSFPPSPGESKRQPTLPQVASQQPSPSKTEPKRQSTLSSQVASQPPSPPSPSEKELKRQSSLPSQVASQPPSPPSPSRPPTLQSQVASQPSSPSTINPDQKPQHPSPSNEPEQKPQPPSEQKPQPSPPSHDISPPQPSHDISLPQPATPQPSPPPHDISLPQPATPREARLPTPSPPTTLLPKHLPQEPPTKPLPQESQPALDASSPTVPAPETQLQNTSKAQESVPEPTTQLTESTQPTESGNQISQKLKPNQIPTDSPMKDVSAQTILINPNKPLQESQPQEIKEEPMIKPEQKQENKPDPLPKFVQGSPDERTNSEVEVNREKNSSVPEKNHTVRKAEEKQEISPTETPKPQSVSEETKEKHERNADLKQNINPEKARETEPISELIRKYNHLTKPEAHLNKPRDRASGESDTKIEPRIAIQVADSRPNTRDLTSEIKMSKPERIMQDNVNVKEKTPENGNGASSREGRIAISTIPKRVFADGEQPNFQKEIKEGLSKLVQKLSTGQHPGGDQGVTIITLAGENKGATMIVDFDEDSMRSNRGFKLTDKVGATRDNHVDQSDRADNANPGITTSVNSNVQNINNSLLQDSSCSEGDPGVHLLISSKPKEPMYLIQKKEMLQSQKTDSSTLQPQKYTYETNVRRRCLRGLLLESSESDPDNPKKPRRHGCRVSCDDKKKGKAEDDGASASIGNRRNKGKHEEMF